MLHEILLTVAVVLGADTSDCGSYPAGYILEGHVVPVLTQVGFYEEVRNMYGLVQQSDSAEHVLEDEPAVCQSLHQYFVENVSGLPSAALLSEHGWHHAVMRAGKYRVLLIVPKQPIGQFVTQPSYLYFFDLDGVFKARLPLL